MSTMYDNMKFADYQFREYPKFVKTGEKKDPNTGHMVPTGVLVNSADEEGALTAPTKPEPKAPAAAAPVPEAAEPAPRPRGRPPGSGKNDVLSTATVDTDHDPDA